MTSEFFVGWDVGGWNCDKNRTSRHAIVILDSDLRVVGAPWRGNLRVTINVSASSRDFMEGLFRLCHAPLSGSAQMTIAVDTPLGVPADYIALVTRQQCVGEIGKASTNPYLYRRTERELFDGLRGPLSAVKDMIGSQSTKGMHVLAKFAPRVERCGVWTDGAALRMIEAYPAASVRAEEDRSALAALVPMANDDLRDARICALVASLFARAPDAFNQPRADVPECEGWIWIPNRGHLRRVLSEGEGKSDVPMEELHA